MRWSYPPSLYRDGSIFRPVFPTRPTSVVSVLSVVIEKELKRPPPIFISTYATMVYTLSVFTNLREQYPQWAALREYLESAEGGRLRVIDTDTEHIHIIRYDKASTDFSKSHVSWFRSVVWDARTNLPLSVAPPKAHTGLPAEEVARWEQFVEGVMVNAFMSTESNDVHLVTRSKLGATGAYYSQRSFSALLEDAVAEVGTSVPALLGAVPDTAHGEVSVFASLLLQHPEHRIVAHVTRPAVYVVHRGRVLATGDVEMDEEIALHGIPTLESATKPASPLTLESMGPWMTAETERRGWQWQGIVLKDGKGGRWRMRSTPYSMVRTMRGDTPRQDVRFLQLRGRNLADTYLFYYPEEHAAFRRLEQEVRSVTQNLYNAYVAAHITKSIPFMDLPAHWRPHVYTLHGQYLGSLRAQGFFIRKKEAIEYVNHLPIPRQLHLMRKLREGGGVAAPPSRDE